MAEGTTLLIVTIATPLFMLLFLNSEGALRIFSIVLLGVALMSPQSVMLASILDLDTKHKAFVNSIYMTMSFFVSAVMAMGAGAIADHIGLAKNIRTVLGAVAGCDILCKKGAFKEVGIGRRAAKGKGGGKVVESNRRPDSLLKIVNMCIYSPKRRSSLIILF
ncbi:MAG: hypothetical protein MZV63_34005 [Marinilabiliales bacterium]|nr:hypothetical protein [Marinilabiliales bacterium]